MTPPPPPSSLYPLHSTKTHPNLKVLTSPLPNTILSKRDHAAIILSSLTVVGAIVWVPLAFTLAYRKYRSIPKDSTDPSDIRKRRLYRVLLGSMLIIGIWGPHRKEGVGKWLQLKRWRLWKAWTRFVALEVVSDITPQRSSPGKREFDMKKDPAIFAIVPHGVFPFAIGFSSLPQLAVDVLGFYRPVVASATRFFPLLNTIIRWLGGVDASPTAVSQALTTPPSRIGISPGGIAEMFEGYPKPGRHPNEECTILSNRKGFLKMALRHQIPVVPIYCFGSSKLMKRLQMPAVVERVSNLVRVSVCLFFGRWGLPIPFRSRLLYVVGEPIMPPAGVGLGGEDSAEFREGVNAMHAKFCKELTRIFDQHKHAYGWDHKTLRIV